MPLEYQLHILIPKKDICKLVNPMLESMHWQCPQQRMLACNTYLWGINVIEPLSKATRKRLP